jgi:hypothetical protein
MLRGASRLNTPEMAYVGELASGVAGLAEETGGRGMACHHVLAVRPCRHHCRTCSAASPLKPYATISSSHESQCCRGWSGVRRHTRVAGSRSPPTARSSCGRSFRVGAGNPCLSWRRCERAGSAGFRRFAHAVMLMTMKLALDERIPLPAVSTPPTGGAPAFGTTHHESGGSAWEWFSHPGGCPAAPPVMAMPGWSPSGQWPAGPQEGHHGDTRRCRG